MKSIRMYIKNWLSIALCCIILLQLFVPLVEATSNGVQMVVKDYSIQSELHTYKVETIYDGTTVEKQYDDYPSAGCDFLLVEVKVSVDDIISGDDFQVTIDGAAYARIQDDSFMANHDYETISHGQILTDTSGWLVFEIPQTASNSENWILSNGALQANLSTADENVVEQVPYNGYAESQSNLIRSYQTQYAKGNYTPENPYIMVNPFGTAPLTALLMFESETPVEVTTTVVGKTERASITNTVSGYNTHHEIPIIGLYNGANTVQMVTREHGTNAKRTYSFAIQTEESNPSITDKQMQVVTSKPEKLSDGLYIIKDNTLTLVDIYGDIRGYFIGFNGMITPSGLDEITENGHIICSTEAYASYATVCEIDAMGFVYHEIQIPRKADHDALYVDESTYLTPQNWIDMNTGETTDWTVLNTIFNSANGSAEVRDHGGGDWLHTNTIEWCGDDAILVSVRNQHAVAKLSYPSFEVEWILSVNLEASPWNADKYLTPIGDDFEWFYSQHDVRLKSVETYDDSGIYEITLFDNGVHRGLDPEASYPENEMYSRMVCYRINENDMTVEQVWEYGQELGAACLSPMHGSTQYIAETDTYLAAFDAYNRRSCDYFEDQTLYPTSIVEVTSDHEVVFDFKINNSYCYRVRKISPSTLYATWEGLDKLHGSYIYTGNETVLYEGGAIPAAAARYGINSVVATQNYLDIGGWAVNTEALAGEYSAAKLLLANQSTGESCVYQMQVDAAQIYNSNQATDIIDQLSPNTSFLGRRLNISTLDGGTYRISILICQNGNEYQVDTEKVLLIDSDMQEVVRNDILTKQQDISEALVTLAGKDAYDLENPYVAVDPYDIAPLSAVAVFTTEQPASIAVSVAGFNGAEPVTNTFTTVSTEHYVPIYGLYEDTATEVILTAYYQNGTTESSSITVTGNALPSDFVPVSVTQADTMQMADGWTFMMAGSLQGYVYAIDEVGSVRWILSQKGLGAASVFLPLENGNYLIGGDKSFGQYYKYSLFELNLSGQIVHEYMIDGYHHDAQELPSGNLLVLANNVDGEVVEDTVYELDRNTGDILRTWDLNSYFNVGNYNEEGKHVSDVNYGADDLDWIHLNGMDYDENSNSLLLSSRHQDAVFSLNLTTGGINWILSNPDDLWPDYLKDKLLKPVGTDFEWQYGQHNISRLPNGDIMLFDNGDYRSKTMEGALDDATESYSRVVIYRIDEENMTASQVWQFGKEFGPTAFAAYVSSAQYLGENHYLIDFGGVVKDAKGNASYNIMDGIAGTSQSQIYEVKDGTVIFHAEVDRNGLHGNTYRAARLAPYTSTKELDITVTPTRVGSLYAYGCATPTSFTADNAVTGGLDVSVTDNGAQLLISATLPQGIAPKQLALVFYNQQVSYKMQLPSGTVISQTLNKSEIPVGTYQLYLLQDGVAYDLALEWTNSTKARSYPNGYNIEVTTNITGAGTVYGSGTYYANTPFTVSIKPVGVTEFIGWYSDGKLLSTEQTYTLTATQDMVLTATFKYNETSGGIGSGGGSVESTVTNPDGSTTTTITNSDGSKSETTTALNGTSSVVNTDKNGKIEAEVTLTESVVTEAAVASEAVELPMSALSATKDKDNAPAVTVNLPFAMTTTVRIPVENITPCTVAMLVNADGTLSVIKTTATTENSVVVSLSDGQTVKIVDNSKSFADVQAGFWGTEAVAFVTSRELFCSTGENTFAPNADMSRATIVTVLARLDGIDTTAGSVWYEAGCQWAVEAGISDGTSMEESLTREQLAVMLYRYSGGPVVSGTITCFADVSSISGWAQDAMLWAVEMEIITGDNGLLNPQERVTGVQAAAMLQRFIQKMQF